MFDILKVEKIIVENGAKLKYAMVCDNNMKAVTISCVANASKFSCQRF